MRVAGGESITLVGVLVRSGLSNLLGLDGQFVRCTLFASISSDGCLTCCNCSDFTIFINGGNLFIGRGPGNGSLVCYFFRKHCSVQSYSITSSEDARADGCRLRSGEACHPEADLVYFFIKQTKNKATTTTPVPMMIHLFAVVTSF